MLCHYCRGRISKEDKSCHFCGRKTDDDCNNNVEIAPYIVVACVFALTMLSFFISTLIFGDESDKLILCYVITVSIAAATIVIYGTFLQLKHFKQVHSKKMKIAQGVIVDCIQRTGLRSRYYPIIEFEVNGKKYRYVYNRDYGSEPKSGRKINIAYNIHKPHDCVLAKDFRGIAIIVVTLIAIGVIGGFGLFITSQLTGGPLLKA